MPDEIEKRDFLEGINAYRDARSQAFWDEIFSLIRGKPAELLSFEDVRTRLRLREEDYKGLQDVPIAQIVGSVGRYHEFTSRFLPKKTVQQDRWSRVYAQANGSIGLPPIELYKIGDVYFVRDGNHRVSVARQLGAKFIQAHVTELPTSISLRPNMTEEELDAAASYAIFLDVTNLGHTRPHHQPILLSEPSRYDDLLGHINLHVAVLSIERDKPISLEQAAAHWYDNVYRPALTLIRKYHILDYSGKRTEADLYLWMVEHLREIRADLDGNTGAKSFSDALVDYLAEKRIAIPKDLLTESTETVEIAAVDAERMLHEAQALREKHQRKSGDGSSEPRPIDPN